MNSEDEFDIRQYISILRRRAWVIAVAIVVCAAVAAAVSLSQDKVYSASSKVVISAQQDLTGTSTQALSDPNQLQTQIDTEVQIAQSPQVEQLANQALGPVKAAQVKSVKASGVTNTRVMTITAVSKTPAIAEAAANAYSDAYLTVGDQDSSARLASIGQTVQQQQQKLQQEVATLNGQIAANPKGNNSSAQSSVNALQNQISLLQQQYDSTQAAALVKESSAQPLSPAVLPTSPSSPKPKRDIALGLVLGALLGIGIALLWERMDDRLRSTSQLSQWFPRLAQLGSVPKARNWKNHAEAKNVTLLDPQGQVAEAYRGIRTSIEFMALDHDLNVIEVTSARAGEGKSTTVANLATAMAWAGKKVIVVSADLRRPRVHDFFGLSNEHGLTTILLNNEPLETVLQTATVKSNGEAGSVQVLATGPLPPNPSELLAGSAVQDIFTKLREHADYVLIDSPPVLPVADALVLSKYSDGIVVVGSVGTVRKKELAQTVETIEKSTHTPLLGVLINGADDELVYSSKYGYYSTATVTQPAPVAPVTESAVVEPEQVVAEEVVVDTETGPVVVDAAADEAVAAQKKTKRKPKTTA